MCSVARVVVAVAGVLSLVSAALQGQRLMELEGIQLRGSARVVAYGAATCEIREGFAGDDKAYDPANRGQPLDVWQLDFSVYNGSGKALDHLIARYNIASEWPPCSSWDGPSAGTVDGTVEWSDTSGLIQESGVVEPGQTLTATTYLVVFHSDEPPQFARWSMDYEFAASPPAGGAGSETARQTTGAPSEPARAGSRFQPEETCAGKEVGSSCWMELENQPGCYLWNGGLAENATVTWSGDCSAGLAQGTGSRTWSYTRDDGKPFSYTSTGELRDGKENGHWTQRFADGDVHEGPYVDGERDGHWTLRFADGDVHEGPYVDGKPNGHWTLRSADGDVHEGPYVDGKPNGHWTLRSADGDVHEGPYVDGERDGRWTYHAANGECLWVSTYSYGEEVDTDLDC